MKIRTVRIDSGQEVMRKLLHELLSLFKIEISSNDEADYESIAIDNEIERGAVATVKTTARLRRLDGGEDSFSVAGRAGADEQPGAAVNRLVKLNIYRLFCRILGEPVAPWGILHGVRPTKMVHKYFANGYTAELAAARLVDDYAVSWEKARRLAWVAVKQRPFLLDADRRTISVYVGVPFCLSRCLYCSFPSYVLPPERELKRFLQALWRDLAAACQLVEDNGLRVESIYIGGGTPTSLPEEDFHELLRLVYEYFYQPDTREFTVEAGRPDSVSSAKIRSMKQFNVNRVSVNPQSMQATTLRRIGRRHTPEDAAALFREFRRQNFAAINMDLIIGLPGETVADVTDTMARISELNPDNITLHALALKKGSKLKLERGDYELDDDAMARDMFDVADQAVLALGMEPYYLYRQSYMRGNLENTGYCHSGQESLYNIKIMEERQIVIGVGPSATTKAPHSSGRFLESSFNPKDLITYTDSISHYIAKRAALVARALAD